MGLEIEAIADTPSFVFLWCGSAEGLDAGRHCLKKWGFRRVEDVCWVKTNREGGGGGGGRKYLSATNQASGTVADLSATLAVHTHRRLCYAAWLMMMMHP